MTWQVPWHEYGPWQVVAMVTEAQKRPEVRAMGWGTQLGAQAEGAARRARGAGGCVGACCSALTEPHPSATPTTLTLRLGAPDPWQVPALEALPSPAFAGMADYLQLMAECWAQDPAQRPSFAAVISRLRKVRAQPPCLKGQGQPPGAVHTGIQACSTRSPPPAPAPPDPGLPHPCPPPPIPPQMLALEAQRQRAHSGATPRYRESPSRASSGAVEGYGAETPVVRSRPIVSIYDLSGSEAGAGGGNGGASAGVRTPSRHPSSFSQRGSDDLAATTSHGTLEPGPGVSTLESLATLPESLPEPAPPGQEARLPPIRGGMAEDGE